MVVVESGQPGVLQIQTEQQGAAKRRPGSAGTPSAAWQGGSAQQDSSSKRSMLQPAPAVLCC